MNFNCIVAQSGGPTAAINASLSGVISACLENNNINTLYGSINGIEGILNDNIVSLYDTFKNQSDLDILKNTPGMFLGSCRFKLSEEDQFKKIFNVFSTHNIKHFFYIGGNDSMDTVLKLSKYAKENNEDVKIIGIPKTVDNDLFGTDHTPGFGPAAKFIATTMLEIAHDTYIYNMKSVTIVEVMGRNAGWLTAATALARNEYNSSPDLIYLPEVPFSTFNFLNDVKRLLKEKNNIIIAVSEGIKDENGKYISASSSAEDQFGHTSLSGTANKLENLVKMAANCKVRSIELSVLQRSAMHNASLTDINESFDVGVFALEAASKGATGKMVTINRPSTSDYNPTIGLVNIEDVANKEKLIPRHWINERGNNVTDEFIEYIRPLIVGEANIKYNNGLPLYMNINHLSKNVI